MAGRHQPDDLHAEYAAHSQDVGEAGIPGGAGRLSGCGNQRVQPCIFAGSGVGRETGSVYQHRAARESSAQCDPAAC